METRIFFNPGDSIANIHDYNEAVRKGQIFKKETGETFLKYLTNYRIQEAKRLLEDNKLSITEISELVGYRTSQYFSQIFIKSVGMRPQEYRRWNKRKQ